MTPKKQDELKLPSKEELLQNFKKFFEEYSQSALEFLENLKTCGNNISVLATEEYANFKQYIESYRSYFSIMDKYYKDSTDQNSFYTGQQVNLPGIVDTGDYNISSVKTDNQKFQNLKETLETLSLGNEKYINQLTDTLMFARNYQKKFIEVQTHLYELVEKYKEATK